MLDGETATRAAAELSTAVAALMEDGVDTATLAYARQPLPQAAARLERLGSEVVVLAQALEVLGRYAGAAP